MAHIGVNDKTASAEVVEKRLKVSRTSVQQVSTGLVLATVERIILIRIKKDGILLLIQNQNHLGATPSSWCANIRASMQEGSF